jgi:hypothetical protein
MRLGIVGHGGDKFTRHTKLRAQHEIIDAISRHGATCVVSGRSPLGGIDVWAENLALNMGIETDIYPPTSRRWSGPGGYMERNLQIADNSDLVLCIVVAELPPHYNDMTFPQCYHCKTTEHVKSGGCWTAKQARRAEWRVI